MTEEELRKKILGGSATASTSFRSENAFPTLYTSKGLMREVLKSDPAEARLASKVLGKDATTEAYYSAKKVAETKYDNLMNDREEGKGLFNKPSEKVDIHDLSNKQRDALAEYYQRYGEAASKAISNGNVEEYYTNKLMQNKIKQEMKSSGFADFIGDLQSNAETSLLSAIHNIEDYGTQVQTWLQPDAISTNDFTNLEKLYNAHPDDKKISNLYNHVNNGEKLTTGTLEGLVDYANEKFKSDFYEANRNTQSKLEEQRYQTEKAKEQLSWDWLGQGILDTEGTIVNMLPSIAVAGATAGAGAPAGLAKFASLATLSANAAGQATNQKISEGYDFTPSFVYGTGVGGFEGLSETIGGEAINSLLFGKIATTPIGKLTAKAIKKAGIEGKTAKVLTAIFSNVGGEMTEEALTASIDPIWGALTLGEDVDPTEYVEGIFKSAVQAIPSTLVLMGFGQAQIISSVNATEKSLASMITSSTDFTNAQKAEMLQKIREVSQNAKLGITENYNDIVNEVYSEVQSANAQNQAIRFYASVVNADENLSEEQKTQQINEFASKFNQTYNPEKLTTQEIEDRYKVEQVRYVSMPQINNEINQMLREDSNVRSATLATEINKVQENIKNIVEKLTGKQLVYLNMEADGEKVYGFTNPTSGNNLYINSNLNTVDTLAASYHEVGHHYKLQYPNLYNSFAKVENVKNLSDYEKEEMFGNYISQIMTKAENVKLVENKTKTLFERLKEIGNQVSNKALGTEIKNQNVSAYNLDTANYLGEDILNDKALEQQVLDTFRSLKPVNQVKEATKTTEKMLQKKQTNTESKKPSLQETYNRMVADNRSEQAIRRTVGLSIGAKPNSDAVDAELARLKGETKFSKESNKDNMINNLRNELAKAGDQRQADEMWAKRTGRAPLIKKIATRDSKIMKLKNDKTNAKTIAKLKKAEQRTQKKMNELRQNLRDTIKKFKSSEAFKYLSVEEQEQFKDSFGSYYLKANSKTELTKQKELVKSMIAQMLDEDPNVVISDRVREMIDAPEQKTFSEIETLEELQTLYDELREVIEQASGVQKLVGLARDIDVQKEKENFVEDVRKRFEPIEQKNALKKQTREQREAKLGGKIVNALGETIDKAKDTIHGFFSGLSTLKTQLLFMAGGDIKSHILDLYRSLQEGVSRERTAYIGLNKSIDKYLKEKKYKELRRSLISSEYKDTGITKKDIYGITRNIRMNDAERISLAFHSMQDQSKAHISGKITDIKVDENGRGKTYKRQGGGLTIPDERLMKAGKMTKAIEAGYTVKLTPQEIDEILGKQIDKNGNVTFTKLTPEQNEFIKTLRDVFFKRTAEYTNEVYHARHGRNIATVENYFPLMTNKAYVYAKDLNADLEKIHDAEALGIIDNSGFLKERSDNAFNPIVLENVTDVITRMMNGVSRYYGYGIALYNNRVLLNAKTEDGITTEDMLNKIDGTFKNNYNKLSEFIAGKRELPRDFMSRFRGKHAEFTLGFNPGVWVKQLLSVPTTLKYYKAKDVIGYIAGGELQLHMAMKRFLESQGIKERGNVLHNFASFLTDDLEYRALGFSNPDAEEFKRNKSLFQKFDILKGISRFDMLGVNTVSRMFLYAELNERGLLDGSMEQISAEELDEMFSDIGQKLESFLRETQPDYSQLNRPNIIRSSGIISRFLTMYSTATLQMYNNLASSRAEMEYGLKSGDAKLAAQMSSRMIKSALGIAVASAGNVAISRLFDKLLKQKDDDDEFDFEKEFLVTLLAPTLVLDDIARGALGLAQYDSQTPELAAYDALLGLAGNIRKLATEEEYKKFKVVEDIVKDLGMVTGIPTRDLMNITRTVLLMSNSDLYYQISLRENQNAYKAWLEKAPNSNAREFYQAYTNTREAKLISDYGYHKADKDAKIKSNLKESRRKALEDVFDSKADVDKYMKILFNYDS